MKVYTGNKMDVAQFAADMVIRFEQDLLSITIITRGKSEDCSVITVTDTALDDVVEEMVKKHSLQLIST